VPCTGAGDTPDVYSSSPQLPIPDSDPVGISDTINVPDATIVGDVNVGIVIDHTWIGDLVISLSHGDSILLWDRACGSEDNMNVRMDDEGAVLVCAIPTTGDIMPESADGAPLGVFDGSSAFGDWTLTVSDNASGDLGVVQSWWIEVGSGTPTCPDQNGGSCFLCDGTGGGDDEDEDGDGDDTSDLDDIGIGGGLIDLQDQNDTASGAGSTDDDVVSEEDREDRRLKARRSTRSR
jgi:subtilisin-like proprotein convertase family protein